MDVKPLEVGKSYRLFWDEDNPYNKVVHCRGIVDGMYVVRWWRYGKRRWQYEVWGDIDLWSYRDVISEK